jgi:hypothetical protein
MKAEYERPGTLLKQVEGEGGSFDGPGGHASYPSAVPVQKLGVLAIAHLTLTVGSTDIPGRSRCCGSWPGAKRIRTGNRCTTLVNI